jgi:hypothetical protein
MMGEFGRGAAIFAGFAGVFFAAGFAAVLTSDCADKVKATVKNKIELSSTFFIEIYFL